MKNPFLISFMALCVAFLIVSLTKPNASETEEFRTKVDRWGMIEKEEIRSSLFNSDQQLLKSITLSKDQILALLSDPTKEKIELKLAIIEGGSIGFIINGVIQSANHSFDSELSILKTGLKSFNPDYYFAYNEGLNQKAFEHLIALAPAIQEVEKWLSASTQELTRAFFTNTDQKVRSLSYNREVLEVALQQESLETFTSFMAINNLGQVSLVSMGRDSNGQLLLPDQLSGSISSNRLFQFVQICPPFCPPSCSDIICPEGETCENGKCKPSTIIEDR